MGSLKPQVESRYCNLIATLTNESISKINGIVASKDLADHKHSDFIKKEKNVRVEIINDNEAIITISVAVDYGLPITEIICQLQEQIKKDIEDATKFTVNKINVFVASINL